MQQRLVTIYLDAFDRRTVQHGLVEEHLREDLAAGWRIVSVNGFGGVEGYARGWFAIVLEKR